MSATADLLRRIEAHCQRHGVAETTFGRVVVNDGKLVQRLRAGGSITMDTFQRIEQALARPVIATPAQPEAAA